MVGLVANAGRPTLIGLHQEVGGVGGVGEGRQHLVQDRLRTNDVWHLCADEHVCLLNISPHAPEAVAQARHGLALAGGVGDEVCGPCCGVDVFTEALASVELQSADCPEHGLRERVCEVEAGRELLSELQLEGGHVQGTADRRDCLPPRGIVIGDDVGPGDARLLEH